MNRIELREDLEIEDNEMLNLYISCLKNNRLVEKIQIGFIWYFKDSFSTIISISRSILKQRRDLDNS